MLVSGEPRLVDPEWDLPAWAPGGPLWEDDKVTPEGILVTRFFNYFPKCAQHADFDDFYEKGIDATGLAAANEGRL